MNAFSETSPLISVCKEVIEKFKIDHVALYNGEGLISSSKSWQAIHEADRTLISMLQLFENDSLIYLTHTSLAEDAKLIGRARYRLGSL